MTTFKEKRQRTGVLGKKYNENITELIALHEGFTLATEPSVMGYILQAMHDVHVDSVKILQEFFELAKKVDEDDEEETEDEYPH